MNDSEEVSEKKEYNKSEQIFYLVFIFAPLVYLLILLSLNGPILYVGKDYELIFSNNLLALLIFVFICFCVTHIIITYIILIPFSHKQHNLEYPFYLNGLILAMGAEVIAVYGLIFGIFFWTIFDFVPFLFVFPFIGFAIIHGIYLYYKYIREQN